MEQYSTQNTQLNGYQKHKSPLGHIHLLTYIIFATANFPADTIFQIQCFRFGNLTGVNADCLKLS